MTLGAGVLDVFEELEEERQEAATDYKPETHNHVDMHQSSQFTHFEHRFHSDLQMISEKKCLYILKGRYVKCNKWLLSHDNIFKTILKFCSVAMWLVYSF